MSLKETLQEDWIKALKSKDKFKANTISMAKAAILQVEKLMEPSLVMKKSLEFWQKKLRRGVKLYLNLKRETGRIL